MIETSSQYINLNKKLISKKIFYKFIYYKYGKVLLFKIKRQNNIKLFLKAFFK